MEEKEREQGQQYTETFPELIQRTLPPHWEYPQHIEPYIQFLCMAPGAELRTAFHAPPQHGKTEVTIRALVWWLLKFPRLRFVYATYSQARADSISKKTAHVAEVAGLKLAKGSTLREWLTEEGGGIIWTSVGGPLTGHAVDGVLVIDDPIKDRQEAESEVKRQAQKDWYDGVADTRLHPGASVICMMTRWHADDLSGFAIRERDFDYVCLKAIADNNRPANDNREPGDALWQSHRPLEGPNGLLAKQRRNPWNFASMYQGEPRPRGGAVFKDPARYRPEAIPAYGFRIANGVDLAYTEKTHADWSVCVEIWRAEDLTSDGKPLFFVRWVTRKQVDAPSFTLALKAQQTKTSAPFYWYAAGTEKGAAQFIQQKGIPLHVLDPFGRDKFTRATAMAEAWNEGRVLVPDTSEEVVWRDQHGNLLDMTWVEDFVSEVCNFTGVKDLHDDQVDAAVPAFDALAGISDDYAAGGGRSDRTRR